MRPIPIPGNIARIDPYIPGKPIEEVERELGLKGSIKLASNENPLGPSPQAIAALKGAMGDLNRYPDGSGLRLRERLAEINGLDPDWIILGNGSSDLVEIIARTFLGADGNAVMANQAFLLYRLAVTAVNGNARVIPLREHAHDLRAMADAVDTRTRLIYIANPNNPTGTYVSHEDLKTFLDRVGDRALVVVDEAYKEYVVAPDYPDTLALLRSGRRLAVLRTFSKIHGLAGVRIGYAMTAPEVIEACERVRSPFNTSRLAQAAALGALADETHVARTREHNRAELRFVQDRLSQMGLSFIPSVANFVLVDTGADCDAMFDALLRQGVIVRPMKAYDFPNSLRVTMGTRAENEAFLAALSSALEHHKSMTL